MGQVMITGLFSQPNYLAAKKLLDATVLRHEAISSNLANLETPNYKRLDVAPSFQSELSQALNGQHPVQIAEARPVLEADREAIGNTRDGHTVQLETELTQLNKNFLAHASATQVDTGSM